MQPSSTLPPSNPAEHGRGLPVYLTSLIGREQDLRAVQDLLAHTGVRLLTLTGPGGSGKTRLAAQAATNMAQLWPGGAVFVALAPLSDPGLVVTTIAQELGVAATGNRPLIESLKDALRHRQLLLVLDNFEHLLAAAPLVSDLLTACPGLKILATSRTPLRLSGEHEFAVPSLQLPGPMLQPSVEHLATLPATRLFLERARAVRSDFGLSARNAAAVAEICRRLDGLPLAIELAAARVRVLPPEALLPRLEHRLQVLTGGARDQPARYQTLRAAIAWSHDLLDSAEQTLLRRLAVFRGGWTLETAAEVTGYRGQGTAETRSVGGIRRRRTVPAPEQPVGDQAFAPVSGKPVVPYDTQPPMPDTLDLVASLVEKNLVVQREGSDGEPRFFMLATIHEFALEQLQASGEGAAMRRRHATYFLGVAGASEPELYSAARQRSDWLTAERDNLRTALQWALDNDQVEPGMRAVGAMNYWYFATSAMPEGRRWAEAFLAHEGSESHRMARAMTLYTAATGGWHQGNAIAYRNRAAESIATVREVGGENWIAFPVALAYLGLALAMQGASASPEAEAVAAESESRARDANHPWLLGLTVTVLGRMEATLGNMAVARSHYEDGAERFRAFGDQVTLPAVLSGLGALYFRTGEIERAQQTLDECLAVARSGGDIRNIALALNNLGHVLGQDRARATAAVAYFVESLTLGREHGYLLNTAACLAGFGALAAVHGEFERAARLFGAADALFAASGATVWPADHIHAESMVEPVRAALGGPAFATAFAAGRAMTLDEAASYALALSAAPATAAVNTSDARSVYPAPALAGAPRYPDGLSVREVEVLRLIAAGKSNQAIADELVISFNTVIRHVTHILSKTGAANRAEAASYAVRRGLS